MQIHLVLGFINTVQFLSLSFGEPALAIYTSGYNTLSNPFSALGTSRIVHVEQADYEMSDKTIPLKVSGILKSPKIRYNAP